MQSIPRTITGREQERGNIKLNGFIAVILVLRAETCTGMAEHPGADAGTRAPPHLAGLPRRPGGKESACPCRRRRFHPWSGRFPGAGNSTPHQYFCLEIPMDGGAWPATVYEAAKSQT